MLIGTRVITMAWVSLSPRLNVQSINI
ncbi:hypothetical protein AvCA_52380 [Azotobacter vinelandii CA]|uniref:Uncharacterized protein n=2 Tax=Azotobacter vinelandii TaxID=354 RepID=C1DNF2_AZOVD|nr:hypothetical protein Avin_52380 [Azotobacter vinelandii DJ]AGK14107.1 hypothetical protein AvCA_52380 [Azotobacter vinelandii CA]AGK22468.1 hypothetical protein AvCA6_52380 [Azotobacter vinelandii CA6]